MEFDGSRTDDTFGMTFVRLALARADAYYKFCDKNKTNLFSSFLFCLATSYLARAFFEQHRLVRRSSHIIETLLSVFWIMEAVRA